MGTTTDRDARKGNTTSGRILVTFGRNDPTEGFVVRYLKSSVSYGTEAGADRAIARWRALGA